MANFPDASVSLLSNKLFADYTNAWSNAVNGGESLQSYFYQNGLQVQYVYFSRDAIEALLSTIGITEVKVKFGLNGNSFTLILFGSNAGGDQVSACYAGTPYAPPSATLTEPVPGVLAYDWINNWRKYTGTIDNNLFKTYDNNFLLGYTYDMQDLMYELYDFKGAVDNYLFFDFVLHKAFLPGAETPDQYTLTFDTVLQKSNDFNNSDYTSTDLYYDISSPCPPTC